MASILFLLIGFFVGIKGYFLGFGTYHAPGPGFVFILSGLLLSILSLIDLLNTFFFKTVPKYSKWSGLKWQRVVLVLIGSSAYVFFFERLGFLLSSFLLLLILFQIIEKTKWWTAVLGSLFSTVMAHVIFNLLLKVPFPIGVLGF